MSLAVHIYKSSDFMNPVALNVCEWMLILKWLVLFWNQHVMDNWTSVPTSETILTTNTTQSLSLCCFCTVLMLFGLL